MLSNSAIISANDNSPILPAATLQGSRPIEIQPFQPEPPHRECYGYAMGTASPTYTDDISSFHGENQAFPLSIARSPEFLETLAMSLHEISCSPWGLAPCLVSLDVDRRPRTQMQCLCKRLNGVDINRRCFSSLFIDTLFRLPKHLNKP